MSKQTDQIAADTKLLFQELLLLIEIFVTLSRQLNWSHFLTLIPIKNENQRFSIVETPIPQAEGLIPVIID